MRLIRRISTWPAVILAVALAVRVTLVLATSDATPQIDAAAYDRIARSLAEGDGFPESPSAAAGGPSATHPPAYPVMLAGIYTLVESTVAARLFQALLGTVSVALLGLLAAQFLGRRAAVAAMAIAAVYPTMVLVDGALLSEVLFIPLMLGSLVAAVTAARSDRPVRMAVLAGVLIGLTILTRQNGALLLLPVTALLLGASRDRWVAVAAAFLAAVLVVLPWTVRNTVEFGRVVPVSTQFGLLIGTYNDRARTSEEHHGSWIPPTWLPELAPLFADRSLDEAELDAILRERTFDYMREHPSYVVTATLHNAKRMLHFGGARFELAQARDRNVPARLYGVARWSFYLLLLLALAGAFLPAARAIPWHLWVTCGLMFAGGAAFAGLTRYRTVADPLLILPAAVALVALSRARGRGGRAPRPCPPSP